jgi:hypothetical protein
VIREVDLENHRGRCDVGGGERTSRGDGDPVDVWPAAAHVDPDQCAGHEDRLPLSRGIHLGPSDQPFLCDRDPRNAVDRIPQCAFGQGAPFGERDPDVVGAEQRVALVMGHLTPGGHAADP